MAWADSGVPMLPPTSTGRTCPRSTSPVRAVVVVLPLVPVMAMTSESITRQASSSSLITGTPRARSGASAGSSRGTPGLITTSSAPANAASGCPLQTAICSVSSRRASADHASRGAASEASTRPPSRATRRAAARPLFASPTTATVLPATQCR